MTSETPDAATAKPRVLIAEDDVIIGMLLAEMLAEMGYDVCAIAPTEAAAVSEALRHDPDLLIFDASLGMGSGVRAIETITRSRAVPHVYVTGDPDRLRTKKPEAIIVQKPFREKELALAITKALTGAARI